MTNIFTQMDIAKSAPASDIPLLHRYRLEKKATISMEGKTEQPQVASSLSTSLVHALNSLRMKELLEEDEEEIRQESRAEAIAAANLPAAPSATTSPVLQPSTVLSGLMSNSIAHGSASATAPASSSILSKKSEEFEDASDGDAGEDELQFELN